MAENWDKDGNGKLIVAPVNAFQVAEFAKDQAVLVRIQVPEEVFQIALQPETAERLSRDLARAAKACRDFKKGG